jgi:hypothetical protein
MPDRYSDLPKILVAVVLLALLTVLLYYYVPSDVATTSSNSQTLLLCEFETLPTTYLNGSTLLNVRINDTIVQFVLTKDRFGRGNLTAAWVKCSNANILAIAPNGFQNGQAIISGDMLQLLTTRGGFVTVLFINKIRSPNAYEEYISLNRSGFVFVALILIWLGSAGFYMSLTDFLERLEPRTGTED